MRLLYGLFLALFAVPALAQVPPPRPPISGHVVTIDARPLAGVSVMVTGTALGASTNADGLFVLPGLGPGAYTLRFDLPGHLLTDVAISDTTRAPLVVKLHSTRPPARPRRR